MNLESKMQQAILLFEQGQFKSAERHCQNILAKNPRRCDALNLLGVLALQSGRQTFGMDLLRRSLTIEPNQPLARSNIGNALLAADQPLEALAQFESALALQPDLAVAHYNRGKALLALGRMDAALDSFDQAIRFGLEDAEMHDDRGKAFMLAGRYAEAEAAFGRALRFSRDNPEILNNLGNALLAGKRPAEALASIERALALAPEFPQALNNRARALAELGRSEEALVSVEQALRLDPSLVEALSNHGNLLLGAERFDAALASFRQALQLRHDAAETHNNIGRALLAMQRFDEALSCFDRALEYEPDFTQALNNRGLALVELARLDEAFASYRRALDLDATFREAMENLGNALAHSMRYGDALAVYDVAVRLPGASASTHFNRGMILLDVSRHEEAAQCFAETSRLDPDFDYVRGYLMFSRLHACDWLHYADDRLDLMKRADAGKRAGDPFQVTAAGSSRETSLRGARTFVADKYPAFPLVDKASRTRPAHDRVRVAYLSADFGEHAVSHVAAGLFERHDRSRFETIAVALRTEQRPGPMRQRLRQAFEQFHDVSAKSDREAAALMRDLDVDIAVDLNGHTSGGRMNIFAMRPAPIQVNYLGYPGTLGADYMDYIIADPVIIPAGEEHAYAEQVVRLPHSYLPYDNRLEIAPDTPSRAQAGLPEQGFVFCAFNNSYKITPAMFDIWMRLLKRVPGSVLWLRSANAAMVRNLSTEASARGVDPQRLVFAPKVGEMAHHFARQRLAGLFLDTLPYNAHSTASDALWAGLPVLTCRGSTFAGRVAASLLQAIGLPELVAENLQEYEERAFELATNPSRLDALRARLAANRLTHPLFDTDLLRQHIESAFVEMWQRHLRNEPPQAFNVHAIH